jgi:hypothetical protein
VLGIQILNHRSGFVTDRPVAGHLARVFGFRVKDGENSVVKHRSKLRNTAERKTPPRTVRPGLDPKNTPSEHRRIQVVLDDASNGRRTPPT